jgi:Putative Actinobacterial Holin-X, holin superfamily III
MATLDAGKPVVEERSLGELVSQLTRDVSLLVRQEVELTKREVGEKLRSLWAGGSSAAAGGVICHIGALAVTAALILLLAEATPAWLAALIVGVVYFAVGGVLLRRGTARLHDVQLEPVETTERLKRDVEAIKEAAQ